MVKGWINKEVLDYDKSYYYGIFKNLEDTRGVLNFKNPIPVTLLTAEEVGELKELMEKNFDIKSLIGFEELRKALKILEGGE